jgi:Zn-dependent protease
MPTGGSVQLARIFGIRIGVNASWFLVLFFFIFILSSSFRDVLDTSDAVAYLTAVASALLFFASIILHELGHALTARREGIETVGIDLWFFGGIARTAGDSRSAGQEFRIAVAGPVVTLAVVLLCLAVGTVAVGWHDFWAAVRFDNGTKVTPLVLLLSWLAEINTLVLVFNLIPAFPLDGGRIARAAAWRVTGDRLRATRVAASLGQAFSYLLIALALYLAFSGLLVTGLWLFFISLFLGQAARAAVAQTAFSERLGGVKVLDIMDREPVAVPAELTAARAQDEFFLRYRWPWFPVVDASGRFVGIVHQPRVDAAVDSDKDGRTVAELMDADDGEWRVGQEASLEAVLGSEPLRRIGALMAVDPEGVLRGVVTIEQVRRALETAVVPGTPAA